MLGAVQLGTYQLGSVANVLVGVPLDVDALELVGTFSGTLAMAGSESLFVTGSGTFSDGLSGSGSEGSDVTSSASDSGISGQIGTVD